MYKAIFEKFKTVNDNEYVIIDVIMNRKVDNILEIVNNNIEYKIKVIYNECFKTDEGYDYRIFCQLTKN